MAKTFKVGSFIRCVHAEDTDLVEGKMYEVLSPKTPGYVTVRLENGMLNAFFPSRFEDNAAILPGNSTSLDELEQAQNMIDEMNRRG